MSEVPKIREVAVCHRQDVKAALCKRYGTLAAFARAKGYSQEAVRDALHGRSKRLLDEIGRELGFAPGCFMIERDKAAA